jgi:hypothetical protein
MSGIDYAFPAADAVTVNTLRTGATASAAQIAALQSTVTNQENANFIQAINAAEANSNNVLTYGTVLSRNITIENVANDMISLNNSTANDTKDTYARQAEINEWQAQNKMDTLFFLQVSFLYFTLIVVLVFLRQYGILPNSVMWIIITLCGIILVGTLWNRASYTYNSRDKRYWNRRFIGLGDSGLSAKAACSNA